MPHGIALVAAFALAMPGVIFADDSYYYPIFFGEELRDPGQAIPRAIFRGLAAIIVMYLLLNAAFHGCCRLRGWRMSRSSAAPARKYCSVCTAIR
jgi:APA family basic amino acid/polyamine antiporter